MSRSGAFKILRLSQYDAEATSPSRADGFSFPDEAALCRPQAKYFLYYPLILAGAALLLWIDLSDSMMAVASGVAAVVGTLMLLETLFREEAVRLTRICTIGLVMGYGAGTLNSWLTVPRGNYPLAAAVGFRVDVLANGLAAALMASAVLLAAGELLEKPVYVHSRQLVIDAGIRRLIVVGAGIIAVAFVTGRFQRGGVVIASAGHAGVLGEFLGFLFYPVVILATVATLVEKVPRQRLQLGIITGVLWVFAMTQSRGGMIYSVLTIIILSRYSGFEWAKITLRRIVITAICAALLVIAVLSYQLLRVAGGGMSNPTLKKEARVVSYWASQGEAWKTATTSSKKNIETRTLIVTFLASLLHLTEHHATAHGKDIWLQLQTAIPSAFDPHKSTMQEEGLASRVFGVFYTDQPNSLLTAGAVDFGIWGVMTYPILIMLTISFVFRWTMGYCSYGVFVFGLALVMDMSLGPEITVTGYVVDIRNLLVFAGFLYLVSKIPAFRLDRGERTVDYAWK